MRLHISILSKEYVVVLMRAARREPVTTFIYSIS